MNKRFGGKGMSARELCKSVEQAEASQRNALPPSLQGSSSSSSTSARKRKMSIADEINKQNIERINNPPPQLNPTLPLPQNMGALLSTVEGQEEFSKLIAQTQKQKDLNRALRARRKEFELFLVQHQQEKIKEDTEKLERKKRKIAEANQKKQQQVVRSSDIIKNIPSHQNSNHMQE